jgi:membrane protein YdbS with pleckstrin-like domain
MPTPPSEVPEETPEGLAVESPGETAADLEGVPRKSLSWPAPLPAEPEEPATPAEDVADGRRRSLDPRYVAQARLTNWIVTGFLATGCSIAFLVLFFRADWEPRVFVAIGGGMLLFLSLCAWVSQAWPPLEFRRTSWRVDAEGIEIKRGVVWRHVIVVPRTRIQHTDVSQGPVQRRFGLATLVIHTAGTHQYMVNLEGLSQPTAFAVRDALLVAGGEDGA